VKREREGGKADRFHNDDVCNGPLEITNDQSSLVAFPPPLAFSTISPMQKLSLALARFSLSAWIGAAVLFVVTSVSEQISTQYGSDVKNILAGLRFPWYYLFGFSFVSTGLVTSIFGLSGVQNRRRRAFVAVMLGLTLMLMATDYFYIYSPLHEIVTRPDGVRDARFIELHHWSERINTIDATLCLVAAIAVCWPERRFADDPKV